MNIRFAISGVAVLLVPAMAAAQPSLSRERLTVDAAVAMALENNRRLAAAQLEVDKAEADLAAVRTRRLPSFEMELSASQLLSPVNFSFPHGAFGDYPGLGPIPSSDTIISVSRRPTYYVSSQVSQPLSQLFRIGLGIRSAALGRDITQERVRGEALAVTNSVKRLYFAILQSQSALAATQEAITLYRDLERTIQVRVAQRVALGSDALDVQFRLAQEELTQATRQHALASQKEQLNQLLGRDVRTAFDVDDDIALSIVDVDLDAAHAYALDNRPDVREARLKLQQADLDRRITKADRIPDVSMAASYISNVNIDVMPANFARVGVRVSWEPFDWGRNRQQLAAKAQTLQQARLALREAEDRTVLEINSLFRTLSDTRARLNVARMAQHAVRERLRVKTNQYQVQAALLPDVLQVRAELADTNDRHQQALLDYFTAKADYERAVGEDVRP